MCYDWHYFCGWSDGVGYMMTQADFDGYGEELEKRLQLKTFPLALKMLAREDDIP